VEPQFLDLGVQPFDKVTEVDLVITNQGKVPFRFALNTRGLSRPSILAAVPRAGTVQAGQREVVKLRVCPGVPARLLETVQVEVAHFDPISVQVGGAVQVGVADTLGPPECAGGWGCVGRRGGRNCSRWCAGGGGCAGWSGSHTRTTLVCRR
jgi:hypothetical protein